VVSRAHGFDHHSPRTTDPSRSAVPIRFRARGSTATGTWAPERRVQLQRQPSGARVHARQGSAMLATLAPGQRPCGRFRGSGPRVRRPGRGLCDDHRDHRALRVPRAEEPHLLVDGGARGGDPRAAHDQRGRGIEPLDRRLAERMAAGEIRQVLVEPEPSRLPDASRADHRKNPRVVRAQSQMARTASITTPAFTAPPPASVRRAHSR
jgi:hypothetical protein